MLLWAIIEASYILNWSSWSWRIYDICIKFIRSCWWTKHEQLYGWSQCSEGLLDSEEDDELLELDEGAFSDGSFTGSGLGGDGGFCSECLEEEELDEESFFFIILFRFAHLSASLCIGERRLQSWFLQPGPNLHTTRKGEFVLSTWYQSWFGQLWSFLHTFTIGDLWSQSWFLHVGPFSHTTSLCFEFSRICFR